MPKGVSEAKGFRNIKSMSTIGKRSIPKAESSAYLDLYILDKKRERLEKENEVLGKRKQIIQKRLHDIKKETAVLKRLCSKEDELQPEQKKKGKWRKMLLHY